MANTIPAEIDPLYPKVIQAGTLHTAEVETAMAHNIQALWYRNCGTMRTWVWTHPDAAPQITTSALNTWTTLQVGSGGTACDAQMPWFGQKHAERIDGIIVLAVSSPSKVKVRVNSSTLVTSVASANGIGTDGTNSPIGPRPTHGAFQRDGIDRLQTYRFSLTPTYPADRRIALSVDIRNEAIFSGYDTAEATYTAYLYSLTARDIFPEVGT